MSFLTERVKSEVIIDGVAYPVNTDFRVWLKIAEIIMGNEQEMQKLSKAVILCYKGSKLPPLFSLAVCGMQEFLAGDAKCEKSGDNGKRVIDFAEDAQLIFASFLYDYGIDLHTVENLHWHKFLALLKNLSADSPLMRVVRIRSFDTRSVKDSTRRSELKRLQREFALDKEEDFVAEELAEIM